MLASSISRIKLLLADSLVCGNKWQWENVYKCCKNCCKWLRKYRKWWKTGTRRRTDNLRYCKGINGYGYCVLRMPHKSPNAADSAVIVRGKIWNPASPVWDFLLYSICQVGNLMILGNLLHICMWTSYFVS